MLRARSQSTIGVLAPEVRTGPGFGFSSSRATAGRAVFRNGMIGGCSSAGSPPRVCPTPAPLPARPAHRSSRRSIDGTFAPIGRVHRQLATVVNGMIQRKQKVADRRELEHSAKIDRPAQAFAVHLLQPLDVARESIRVPTVHIVGGAYRFRPGQRRQVKCAVDHGFDEPVLCGDDVPGEVDCVSDDLVGFVVDLVGGIGR